MSKKGWRWFDRAVFFVFLSAAGMAVVSAAREYLMEKGYLLPDDQKAHLRDGAAHVRKKFDNAKITPPTQETFDRVNRSAFSANRQDTSLPTPRRSFSERVGDPLKFGGKSSPLGSPLSGEPDIPTEVIDVDKPFMPVVASKNLITSTGAESMRPVETQVSKSTPVSTSKKTTSLLPKISKNGFAIDLKTQTGELRRFYFDMRSTSNANAKIANVSEYSGKISEIGGNMKINIVCYDPAHIANGGMPFSVIFNHKKGFLTAPYDSSLGQTIYIAAGDQIALSYNQRTKNISICSDQLRIPSDIKKVGCVERYISAKNVAVPQRAIQLRKSNKVLISQANTVHTR